MVIEEALQAALEAKKDGLLGLYPTACIVLANRYLMLEAQLDECRKLRNDMIAQLRNSQ